jgi:RND family efflux transporter MFP subunit
MKRIKNILSFFLHHKKMTVIGVVIFGVIGFILMPKAQAEIKTVKVVKEDITESITASGSIDSETSVNLNFLTGGKLVYVGAKKGDEVKKGQTIAQLDQRSMKKNFEQAVREAHKQRNAFDTVQEDNQNRQPYQALSDEMRRLLENNQYDLDKAITSMELQQISIEQSYLTSPIDGVLIRADAPVPGINVGATTTYTIADPENLVFQIEVDEADIGKVTLGMPVNVTLDAFPDHTLPLQISYIDFASHTTDTGGNVYTVEAKFPPNTDYRYRIGMSGDAEIVIDEKKNVLSIPLSSLLDNNHVYVKTEEGFEKRKITTGLQSDINIEVTSGLKAGEEIAEQPEEAEKTMKPQ